MQKIAQNGGMFQQMMMLAQMADQAHGGNEITAGIAQQYGIQIPGVSGENVDDIEALGGRNSGESSNTSEAESG